MAWLHGWDFRKEITVTENSGSALADFQTQVDVTYDADMQADFDDVRFTGSDGETLLSHWLQTKVDSTSATFWVKVPSIPSSSTATIYMYYGNAGASSTSNIRTTFLDGDDFARTNVNEPTTWSKSANNPLTAAGYGDPFTFYESGTYYLFVDDLSSGNIRLFTDTDPEFQTATNVGEVLTKGTSGAWDDSHIRDAHVVKVGSTYHMWYGGSGGGSGTEHAVGHATASALTGPWTKDGSNPVLDLATGCNEPGVHYDANAAAGEEFKMLYTFNGRSPTADDVGVGNIGLAYSADGSTWVDQGAVLTGAPSGNEAWQDQQQIIDADGIFHMFVNDGANIIRQSLSLDHKKWSTPTAGGGLALGAGGTYDDGGVFAPGLVKVGSTYYLYYQASDGANQAIALATSSALTADRWNQLTTAIFVISSGRLYKNVNHTAGWRVIKNRLAVTPPYVFEADLEFETENTAGYTYGVRFAHDATLFYGAIFDPSANQIGLWQNNYPETSTTSNVPSNTTAHAVDLATAHKIRVTVTATNISVDWHTGSAWQTNVLSRAGTYVAAYPGFYNYDDNSGTNQNRLFVDNFRVRKHATTAPSVAFGSEETEEVNAPRPGVSLANGVMMV